jgi:hypothetical protein
MKRIRNMLATTIGVAVVLLTFFAGVATASRALSIEPSRGLITLTSNHPWTFTAAGGLAVICERVIIKASLSTERVSKAAANRLPEAMIGWVTEGTAAGCRESVLGAAVTTVILARKTASRTWFPIGYFGFLGTLPTITGVLIFILHAEISFTISVIGLCLYRGDLGNLIRLNEITGRTVSNRWLEVDSAFLINTENRNCPLEGRLAGEGLLSPILTFRLI